MSALPDPFHLGTNHEGAVLFKTRPFFLKKTLKMLIAIEGFDRTKPSPCVEVVRFVKRSGESQQAHQHDGYAQVAPRQGFDVIED